MSGRATLRVVALTVVLLVSGLAGPTVAAAADPVPPVTSTPAAAVLAVAQQGVANAAAQHVEQSVAVIDRSTGRLIADVGGRQVYNTESITKLFTAAYYLEKAQGVPGPDLGAQLSRMIEVSDDDIQSALWRPDIVPTVARRYGLTQSTNAPDASDSTWGSNRTTADDQVTFLLRASQDPWVGPSLLSWMAAAQPTGADGFDQSFGLLALAGDRGAKQGWSDEGWTPANLHSVGWTDHYFIAILQSSATAGNDTMRATSTFTAQLIGGDPAVASTTASAASSADSSTQAPPSTASTSPMIELDESVLDVIFSADFLSAFRS